MDKKPKKTWLTVVLAGLVVVVLLGLTVVGGGVYFVYRHVRTESIGGQAAGERLARERQRFGGRQPLVEIRDRDEVVLHRPDAPAAAGRAELQALRVLVHDPREERLVDVDIPFWLLRLMPSGRLSLLDDTGMHLEADRLRITTQDLEAFGPGVILDYDDPRGASVLIWTE